MPGQEVPAAVLALCPIGARGRRCSATGRSELRSPDLLPQVRIEAVDAAEEAPAGAIVQGARLHRLDAARIRKIQ